MKKNTVEEAIKQLKIAISEMKEVKSFTLEQNGTNCEIIVESQDEISCRINLTMMDIYFYITKHSIYTFCFMFTIKIICELEKVREINKALEQGYKNKDKIKIKKLMMLKYSNQIDTRNIKQYVTIK